MINMDFVVGLPRTPRKFDSIWVIVDRLTKSTHFLPVKATDTTEQYAQLYIKEIVMLDGTKISIISDRGACNYGQWSPSHISISIFTKCRLCWQYYLGSKDIALCGGHHLHKLYPFFYTLEAKIFFSYKREGH